MFSFYLGRKTPHARDVVMISKCSFFVGQQRVNTRNCLSFSIYTNKKARCFLTAREFLVFTRCFMIQEFNFS